MWFLTSAESAEWAKGRGFELYDNGTPFHHMVNHVVDIGLYKYKVSQYLWLSRVVGGAVEPFEECLFWITEWQVWDSDLNLYYRLRTSHGDRRRLVDASGHLFAWHERNELASFVYLALLFGWDCHLLPAPGYSTAFISHDEYVKVHFEHDCDARELRQTLEPKPPFEASTEPTG